METWKDKMKEKDGLKEERKRVENKKMKHDRISRTKQSGRGSKNNGEKSRPGSWKMVFERNKKRNCKEKYNMKEGWEEKKESGAKWFCSRSRKYEQRQSAREGCLDDSAKPQIMFNLHRILY